MPFTGIPIVLTTILFPPKKKTKTQTALMGLLSVHITSHFQPEFIGALLKVLTSKLCMRLDENEI